ncbi:MAG: hypothetical protein JSU94_07005 [Phycisphaerales bacterium]|nr:MAG: hypothetical protein JSU94_07005 [Phycisphaerales bacterium]
MKHILPCLAFFLFAPMTIGYAEVTVADLLDNYEQAQQLRRRRHVTSETVSRYTNSNTGNTLFHWSSSELFADADRVDLSGTGWLPIENKDAKPTTIPERRVRTIWDGANWYEHKDREKIEHSYVYMSTDVKWRNEYYSIAYHGASFEGTFPGDMEPVSSILRTAERLELSARREYVGDVACYVIEAQGPNGAYKIWLDPKHGYNICRAEIRKYPGHLYADQPLPASPSLERQFILHDINFANHDGIWIPIEGKLTSTTLHEGGRTETELFYHRVTALDLAPDFDASKAFVPRVRNGTRVYNDTTRLTQEAVQLEWKDGRPVKRMSHETIAVIEQTAERLLKNSLPPLDRTQLSNQSHSETGPNDQTSGRKSAADGIRPDNLPQGAVSRFSVLFCLIIGAPVIVVIAAALLLARRRRKGQQHEVF